jgi:hypothetical protein
MKLPFWLAGAACLVVAVVPAQNRVPAGDFR